jgi:3-ketosteroid 9alpha-monooxygenase subunit A
MATGEMTLHGLSLDLSGSNTTPVDDQHTEMFATYWIDRRPGDTEDGTYRRRLDQAKSAMPDDLNIWNNQIFLDSPALATSEGRGFRAMRRWTRQFYPGDSEFTAGSQSLHEGDTP